MSDPKKPEGGGEKMTPGKLFAYFAAVGIGLILLSMGAEGLYNFARSLSMGLDMLTKPILIALVAFGLFKAFSASKKDDDHH